MNKIHKIMGTLLGLSMSVSTPVGAGTGTPAGTRVVPTTVKSVPTTTPVTTVPTTTTTTTTTPTPVTTSTTPTTTRPATTTTPVAGAPADVSTVAVPPATVSVTAFNALTGVQYPVFSNDLNNKMQQFTQLFTTLSGYTTLADWQKALDLYEKQVIGPVTGMPSATGDQLELVKTLSNTLVSTVSLAYNQIQTDTTDGQQKRNLLSPAVGKLNAFIAALTKRADMLRAHSTASTPGVVTARATSTVLRPLPKIDLVAGKSKIATEPTVAERRALDAAGKVKLGDRDQMQLFKALFLTLNRASASTVIEQACKLFVEKVLTPAEKSTTIKLFELQDIKATNDILVTTLTDIAGQLDTSKATIHTLVTKQIHSISGLGDALATRIAAQQSIASALVDIGRLVADRLDDRMTAYEMLFGKLNVHTLDEFKSNVLKGIADLASDVQSRGGSNVDKFKQFINRLQGLACFSADQKKILAALLSDRPAIKTKALAAQTSQDAGKVNPLMEAKLKDVYDNSKTGAEKCAITRELIAMITPSASVADKNKVTTLCTQLFMIMGAMALSQLQDLQQVLRDALGNAYLLSPVQRPSIEQWIKTLEFAKQFADVARPLIDCVKQYIADYRINLDKALDAAYLGVSLLGTKIAPAELDKMKPESLFSLLRDKLPLFYQARNTKNIDVLNDIRRLVEAASVSDNLKGFVGKDWLDQMGVLIQLFGIQAQKTYLERLQQYEALGKTLKVLGSYEKSIVMTDLATVFTSRHERAQKELEIFVKVIDVFVGDKKIFDDKDRVQFATWKKFLQIDMQFMGLSFEPNFDKKIITIDQALPLLVDKQMDHERDLLVMALGTIYAERGNEGVKNIDLFATLLRKIRNMSGLLFARQASDIDQWSQELVFAKQAAAGATTYLQGLLALAQKMKSVDYYTRSLDLFTNKTPQVRVNEIVGGLNGLVQAYPMLDSDTTRRDLGPLLAAMHGKMIGTLPLLTAMQREAVAKILGMMRLKAT